MNDAEHYAEHQRLWAAIKVLRKELTTLSERQMQLADTLYYHERGEPQEREKDEGETRWDG